MPVAQDQRPRFYQGQYLGPDDLTAVTEYSRIRQARHSLGAHAWGIAIGLQLIETPSPAGNNQVDVSLVPGYAWDGFGMPVVVRAPYKLPASLFQSISYDPSQDGGSPPGRLVKIWLRYQENSTQPPQAGFEVCDVQDQNSRWQETYAVEVGERPNVSDQRDPLAIGGKTVDALGALQKFDPNALPVYDTSIPQQDLPEEDGTALWLIPVGYVRWLPNTDPTQAGSFIQRTDGDLAAGNAFRQCAGVVAGSVLAADTQIHVRTRGYQLSDLAKMKDDLLLVEGRLRAYDDIRLFGAKISFLDSSGQDNNGIPLFLQRFDQPGILSELQVVIGKSNQGNNSLAVGPLDPNNNNAFVPELCVRDDGKVGIGTTSPDRALTIQGNAGTYLNVKDKADSVEVLLGADSNGGIVSTMTNHDLVLRSGGNTDRMILKASGQAGIGTDSPTGRLTLNGIIQPQQGLLTFFSSTADIEYDGGSDHLFIFNATGGAATALLGGNVGIGTSSPSDTLDVAGSLRVNTGANPLRFTSSWTAFPDAVTNQAEICNDTTNYKTLMIVGNRSAGMGPGLGRRVSIWDRLDVNGTLQVTGRIGASGFNADSGYPAGWGGGIHTWDVYAEGTVGAGSGGSLTAYMNSGGNLYVSGTASKPGGGAWTDSSDARLKKDIQPLREALQRMLRLRGVQFQWIDPKSHGNLMGPQVGLIAHEVEQVFPEWVSVGEGGFKQVTVRGFEALTVEALRELRAENEELVRRLRACEDHIAASKDAANVPAEVKK